ncbi:MAG: TolC family protein [Acidobacteria bacterium]|nr:TolC family protein [Acidobacteriota bacterium]
MCAFKRISLWAGLVAVIPLLAQDLSTPPRSVTLDQAIQEAMAKNLDIATQKLSVSVAEARQITAALRPNPVLTVAGQTLNLLGANFSPDTPLGPNQFNIHTDFPIERGGKRQERIQLAKEQKSLAELNVRELMRQVIGTVQNAYTDVLQAKRALALAHQNLSYLEGIVSINEARLKSGDLAQVELERSRVAALQYRTAIQQTQLQVDQAKTQLQFLMGRKSTSPDFDVLGDLRREELSGGPADLLKLALQRRPDYLTARQYNVRSQADLRLQIANGKIDYSVGAEVTHQRAWGVSGNSVGLYVSVPLPVFNRNQGEIARAQREINQSASLGAALEASIGNEVEKAFRQYSVYRQLVTNVESGLLAKAKQVRDVTEYSYRRGEASLVEFLDAQRAYNDSMQLFNEASANFARSLYWIDTVSGATVSGN